jgi:hypothetical protein
MNKLDRISDPFLLVFDSRSGSTFLANLLVKFVGAAIPPETNFITALLSKYEKETIDNDSDLKQTIDIIYQDNKFSDWKLDRAELENYIDRSFPLTIRDLILEICTLYKQNNYPNSQFFGLKKGVYLTKHREMKQLFPQAKFVGITRDGRAVFNSKKHSIYSVTGKPFETDPDRAAKEWCRIYSFLQEVIQKYPTEIINIQYEKMIEDPDSVIAELREFFNISEVKEFGDNSYVISERYRNLHKNVKKEPLEKRITAWQQTLSAEEIYAFESVAYKQLLLAGYPTVNSKTMLRSRLLNKAWQSFQSVLNNRAN